MSFVEIRQVHGLKVKTAASTPWGNAAPPVDLSSLVAERTNRARSKAPGNTPRGRGGTESSPVPFLSSGKGKGTGVTF